MASNTIRTERDTLKQHVYSVRNNTSELVFFDAQVPDKEVVLNENTKIQTHNILEHIQTVADEIGIGPQDLMRTTIYLTDMNDLEVVKQAYNEFFECQLPSRSFVGVEELPNDATVQIEATGVSK